MNPDNNLTLPEIHRQLNEAIQRVAVLRTIENRLMGDCLPVNEQLPIDEIVLQFDDTARTVSWLNNSVPLTPKSYLLLKTLWQSPKHRADYETVERNVWEKRSKKECIPAATIKILVYRTNKFLKQNRFPYKIRPAKSKKSKEILGFLLK
ncbi:MAG: hypothetical protein LBU65_01025 [Planctomycetaceae bacterium]|nr:hypothetical protein [Planctomycetaceae bacterium]